MKTMKERRCVRESSLNTSLSKDDTDIFEEGIESPHCWHATMPAFYKAACKIWKKR